MATQLGDPLAHGEEGFSHCVSADRLVGAIAAPVAAAHGEGDEVTQSEFFRGLVIISNDITEGRIDPVLGAELAPVPKGAMFGGGVL